ncbi:tyrosine-protein phosphatase non-receptor type 5 isoform X2 [Entelurus aequoreus]|uniref:tyrosine-protein phosphatase non-receptor type 5 isoform X2 n=1 Tax=Entelurus aequoreus TaxID=161455 RepID=UPI002B1E52EB|nr:tyrosine-protein phosphatase non-receptor type 5 isoform X2 [Entelurus aequoreus]
MKMVLTRGVFLLCWLLQAESSSGDHKLPLHFRPRPPPAHTQLDSNLQQEPHHLHHHNHHRHHPHVDDVHVEHATVSAHHLVTMFLAVDVRRLNTGLLAKFRGGVAAALSVPIGRVHINRLNEEKNGVELFVSSDRPDISEPRSAEEVIRALNVRVLHRHLAHFGITEVSTENILQGEPHDHVLTEESYYAAVLFLAVFIIFITCLMVLFSLKEKASAEQLKAPPPYFYFTPKVTPDCGHRSKVNKAVTLGSMVQTKGSFATTTLQQQPITVFPPSSPAPVPFINNIDPPPPVSVAPVINELKTCPSPFRMKPASGLQERRGSNVSLVLDMSALASVEPLDVAVVTPRETAAREYLLAASRPLTPQQLRDIIDDTQRLHAEFAEIPMNFTDRKQLDISNYGTKNRYKTILPNPHTRVHLHSRGSADPLSSYINANYVRGYRGNEKAFIATQGPMVNTVDDFWLMAWQEAAPAIVMITKLKEKKEKCVLYWPERRGIYGKVEVAVSGVRKSEHYTARRLSLKYKDRTHVLQHYWFTSWPDHKTPDSAVPLLQLMDDVETERRAASPAGPVIVHCSAGIGRTGCFIAAAIGCRQLEAEDAVDLLGIVCQLRVDRGGMIQTGEQYHFVHHALSLYQSRLSAQNGR